MKKGETFFHYPFKVVYQNIASEEGNMQPNAVMVSVPKRNFKRAVKRNLLKRRIRESYRLNKEIFWRRLWVLLLQRWFPKVK